MFRLLLITALLAGAHPFEFEPRWFLLAASDPVTPKTKAAIFKAACDGTVVDSGCDTCPGEDKPSGTTWTVRSIRTGHFLSPKSQDIFLTIDGCNLPGANGAGGMLLTRRDGEWQSLDYVIALETDHCRKMQFTRGRDLLICEMQSGGTYFHERSIAAVFADKDAIQLRSLLAAGDTTLNCSDDFAARMTLIRKIEFRDVNGDGREDIVIRADFGRMTMTARRVEQCKAAWEDYIHQPSNPKKHPALLPDPPTVKSYVITYLFDGKRFQATPESEVPLRLIKWDR
jgi:hypothetical protein